MVFHTMIQRQKLSAFQNEKKTSLRKNLRVVPNYVKIKGQAPGL